MTSQRMQMDINATLVSVLSIIFIATVFRSAFGFGESLVGVPLLAIWIPIDVAVPLSVLVSTTIAGIVVVQDWKKIHFQSAGGLILFTLPGIPLGLVLLTRLDGGIVKAMLGIIIIAFALYSLRSKPLKELKTDSLAWLFGCGFLAGIFGGAYGLNGPPLVVYGARRRWSARHFRATLQGYFLIASMVGVAGYWLSGLIDSELVHYYLLSLPVMVPAVFIGRIINHRLHGENFLKYVYGILLAIGIFLLIRAVSSQL